MFNGKSNDEILKELEGEYTGNSFFYKNNLTSKREINNFVIKTANFITIQEKNKNYQEACEDQGLLTQSHIKTRNEVNYRGGTREASAASTKLTPGINLTRTATYCASVRPTLATNCASSFGVVAEAHTVTQENPRNTLGKQPK